MNDVRAVDQTPYGEQRWACESPPSGSTFKVLRDEWSVDYTIRTIYGWEAA